MLGSLGSCEWGVPLLQTVNKNMTCVIYTEFEKFMLLTRGMTTKENVQVPPIKYSTKRPEHSGQTIIDINVKNPLPALPVPNVSQIPQQPIEPLVPIPAKNQKRKAKNRTKQRAHTNVSVPDLAPPPINDIPDNEHIEKDDGTKINNDALGAPTLPPLPIPDYPPFLPTPPDNIPAPLVQSQLSAPIEPHYQSATKSLPKVERNTYKSISQFLNPLPIDVSFRGELPAFDKDKDDTIDLPALSIEAEFKDAKRPLEKSGNFSQFLFFFDFLIELHLLNRFLYLVNSLNKTLKKMLENGKKGTMKRNIY